MNIIIIILSIIITIYILYFAYNALYIFKNKKEDNIGNIEHKFAILIPASNEEIVIGSLLDSLNKLDYSSIKYEIYVIINNCTDNTEKIAKKKKANIIKCNNNIKSKGEALEYAYNYLSKRNDIDAYVIFDADNIVDSNFLTNMNKGLNRGYEIAHGFLDTRNIYDNSLTSSYAILYYLYGFLINKPRYNRNKSCFITGTGFMVKKEIIDKYGFKTKTLLEDGEFTIQCSLNDEKIAYVEDAICYTEQVSSFKTSLKQRRRWSFGSYQCLKCYGKDLIRRHTMQCIDVLMFYTMIIIQIIGILLFILTLIFNINIILNKITLIIFAIYILLSIIFRMMIIKYYHKSVSKSIGGILLFDLFLLSWIPISFISLFKKECNWDKIEHKRNIGEIE